MSDMALSQEELEAYADEVAARREEPSYAGSTRAGVNNLAAGYFGANAWLGDFLAKYGPEATKQYMQNFAEVARANEYHNQQEAAQAGGIDYEKEWDNGNYLRSILAGAAANAPQMALTAIPGVGLGKWVGMAPAAIGKLTGGLGAALAANQMTGEAYNQSNDLLYAPLAGFASGAGAYFGDKFLGAGLGGLVAKKPVSGMMLPKSAVKEGAKTLLGVAGSEVPSEGLDSLLETGAGNLGKGLPWSADFANRLVKAGKQGLMGGAIAGVYGGPAAIGSAVNQARANQQLDAIKRFEQDRDADPANAWSEFNAETPPSEQKLDEAATNILDNTQLLEEPAPKDLVKKDAEGKEDPIATRKATIADDVSRLQGIEKTRQQIQKTDSDRALQQESLKAAQAQRKQDAFQRFADWQEQVRSNNQKRQQERIKTASTMQQARQKAAEGMEKFKQSQVKTMSDRAKLVQSIQKIQEANQPKMSAAEQKEQNELQAANALAPQLLQKTAEVLNPQLKQQREQQAQQEQQRLLQEAQERGRRLQQMNEGLRAANQRYSRAPVDRWGRETLDLPQTPYTPNSANSVYGGEVGLRNLGDPNLINSRSRAVVQEKQSLASGLISKYKTAIEIWKRTGWFRGADNQWRFEIPDDIGDVSYPSAGVRVTTVGSLYDNPKLYKAYPILKNTQVTLTSNPFDAQGSAHNGKIKIQDLRITTGMNNEQALKSMSKTLIHEIQHLVQNIEGFARGGMPEEFAKLVTNAKAKQKALRAVEKSHPGMYKDAKRLFKVEQNFMNQMDSMPDVDAAAEAFNLRVDKIYDKVAKKHGVSKELLTKTVGMLSYFTDKEVQMAIRASDETDLYNWLAGEIEANDVMDRATSPSMGWIRDEMSFPDVRNHKDVIIRYNKQSPSRQESRDKTPKQLNADIARIMKKSARSIEWTGKREKAAFDEAVDQFYTDFTVDMSDSFKARITPENARTRAQIAQDEADRSLLDVRAAWNDVKSKWPALKDWFLESFTDALYPVYQMVKSVKQDGRVTFFSNIYKMSEAYPNIVGQRLKSLHQQLVIPLEKALTAYAKASGAKNNEVAYAQAADYWEAMAILERKNAVAASNPNAPEYMPERSYKSLIDILNKYSAQDMMPVGKAIQAINNAKLDMLVADKVITPEVAANFRAKYKSYMPLFVDWDAMVQAVDPAWAKSYSRKSISAGTAKQKYIREVKANSGDIAIKDPIVAAIQQMYDAAMLSKKIKIQRGVLELIKDNPNMTQVREVRTKDTSKLFEFDVESGQIKSRKLLQDMPTQEGGRRVRTENTIVCIDEEGNARRVEFADGRVAAALKSENVTSLGVMLRTAKQVGRLFMQLVTGKSPLFWTTNPIRDTQTAAFNIASLKKSLENVVDLNRSNIIIELLKRGLDDIFSLVRPGTRGIRSALFHYYKTGDASLSKAKNVDEKTKALMARFPAFLQFGGATSYFSDSYEKAIQTSLIKGMNSKNPTTKTQAMKNFFSGISQWMDAVSDSLENKTRYLIFNSVVEAIEAGTKQPDGTFKGKNGNTLTQEEIYARAANAAMNITVNFTKKGTYAPVLDTLYWFSGANIAGNMRMLETVVRKGADGKVDWSNIAAFAAGPIMLYMALSAMCREVMGDDEDGINFYDKIPEYIKDRNIILPNPIGGDNYIKIPVAYGYNIFWGMGAFADAAYSMATGKPGPTVGDATLRVFANAFDNFNVMGGGGEGMGMMVPSTVRPFFQWGINKDFAGRPISKEGTQAFGGKNIPDSERAWATMSPMVTELCQWVNEATGGSQVRSGLVDVSPETLEHFASAYTGGIGRIAMTSAARIAEWARTGQPDVTKLAGYGIFLGKIRPSDTNVVFSNYRDVITSAVNETKLAQTDSDMSPQRKAELIARNAEAYKLKDKMNLVQRRINDLSKKQKDLRKQGAGDAAIEALEEQKYQFRKDLIKSAVNAGIPSKL